MRAGLDSELLMEAQYNLPLTETPFVDLAENLGRKPEDVIKALRYYVKIGVVKRVGPQLNYKAFREIGFAALVGAKIGDVEKAVGIINAEKGVKHNFLRDHPVYNLWFTIKAESLDALIEKTRSLMRDCGAERYLILPSKRVYKMDVKYDLNRGVSWSEIVEERDDVKRIDDEEIGKMLKDMERSFPIEERPFKKFSKKYGYKEEEIVDLISEMVEERVVRDFYAVLNGQKSGFVENGMNLVRTEDPEGVAKRLLRKFPEITHLVERGVERDWNYPLYFMVHAVKREIIREIAERAGKIRGIEEIKILFSLKSFKD